MDTKKHGSELIHAFYISVNSVMLDIINNNAELLQYY